MSPDVPCTFCGEPVDPAGIRNHETWCDANPEPGVPVDKQRELGMLEDVDERAADPKSEADLTADQEGSEDVDLPPRQTAEGTRARAAAGGDGCPCGSGDTLPAYEARERFAEELGELPASLTACFDAAERYCNRCWSLSGGELDERWSLQEAVQ